jgi:hypothetical protein
MIADVTESRLELAGRDAALASDVVCTITPGFDQRRRGRAR